MISKQKKLGQFFTMKNPFDNDLFQEWKSLIPNFDKQILLEPFAGTNNIIKFLQEMGINNNWYCFDIDPPLSNNVSKFKVIKKDVLKEFPKGFDVAITNPPYLAKNSASRYGIKFPKTKYNDVYQVCLMKMLKNVDFIAAIVPESFITQNLFRERLWGVISLHDKLFKDTTFPVCLALFSPSKDLDIEDFYILKDRKKKRFSELKKYDDELLKFNDVNNWAFNEKDGVIGLVAVDSTRTEKIKFILGKDMDLKKIQKSSRGLSRINYNGNLNEINVEDLIEKANEILEQYRKNTKDVFLTSFRGISGTGEYRRRLDYKKAKLILSKALNSLILKI